MKLKKTLDTLDGLDESTAKLYTKGDDGKFRLEVEDEDEPGDGLKSALQKERKRAEEAEKALKAKLKSEEDAKTQREREDMEKRGEYDKLRAQDTAKIDELTKQLEGQKANIHRERIGRATLEALGKHGGITKALAHHLEGLLEHVADGDGYKVVVKGEPALTPDALVAKWKADPEWAFGFNGSGMAGGGTPPAGGGGSSPHAQFFDSKNPNFNYTKQMELAKADPKAFESLRAQFPQPTE